MSIGFSGSAFRPAGRRRASASGSPRAASALPSTPLSGLPAAGEGRPPGSSFRRLRPSDGASSRPGADPSRP